MQRCKSLSGAVLTVLVLAWGSAAQGRPVKHRFHPDQAAEIEALKEEVRALKARLDAQDLLQAQNSVRLDQVHAQAEAASQASAASNQAHAVPPQVAGQAPVPAPSPQAAGAQTATAQPKWYENTTVGGRVFFNISHIDQKVNGVHPAGEPNGVTNGTGFNVKRVYISIDHKFNDVFSADLTTDIANAVGRTSFGDFNNFTSASDAQLIGRGLFIKKAYLTAKLSPAVSIRVGEADMPWIPYVESIYGYRHIDPTLADRTLFANSTDWGVHVLGDLADGHINYQVSVVDGAGFRNVRVTNAMDVEARLSANYKGFYAAVGGYTGKLGSKVPGTPNYNTASRLNAMLAYKQKGITLGGEYFRAHDYNNNGVNYITNEVDDHAEGYSVFGSYQLRPKWSAFGRYDWVKPRENGVPGFTDNYYNVGVQYSPLTLIDLALVYKHERAANGVISTLTGTIGGSENGTYDEFGLYGQFRF